MPRKISLIMKLIQKKNNEIYYFRKAIPEDVRSPNGAKEINLSLNTKDKNEAIRLAQKMIDYSNHFIEVARLAEQKVFWNRPSKMKPGQDVFFNLIACLRRGDIEYKIEGTVEEAPAIRDLINQMAWTEQEKPVIEKPQKPKKEKQEEVLPQDIDLNEKTLSALVDEYLESEERRKLSKNTLISKRSSLNEFLWVIEKIKYPSEINVPVAKNIIKKIFALPKKSDYTLSVEKNLKLSSEPRSYSTSLLRGMEIIMFFTWLLNENYVESVVFDRRFFPKKTKSLEDESYENFTIEELNLIFNNPAILKDEQCYWLLVLGLFTGCRINEIAQLTTKDVVLDADIPYFDINAKNGKTIKNKSSIRKVPIHPKLFELGLEKYINELNLFKIQNLFALPHPTNVFTRYKQLIDFPAEQERRKVFHSFRHTFVSQLQLAHVPLEVRQNLVGHTSGNITVDIYGTDSSLKDKFEGIKKLAFENLKILPYTPTTQFRAKRRARMARAKKK